MKAKINKSTAKGNINAPASKSMAHRYLIGAALSGKVCNIHGVDYSEDILASIDILEDIIDCVSFLSLGIAFWKKESMFPIICFIMSGLQFICIFL